MKHAFPEPVAKGRLLWDGKGQPKPLDSGPRRIFERVGGFCEDPGLFFQGDNLQAMAALLERGLESAFQLVYIDPPFCSGKDYVRTLRLRGGPGNTKSAGEAIGQQVQYTDVWSEDSYLQFCYERLLMIRRLLNDSGSLVLHVDEHMSHLLRCVLDEVFGSECFVNEIVWHYPDNFQGNVRGLANNHNLLFWYSKSRSFKAHPVRIPLDKPTKRDRRVWDKTLGKVVAARDEQGRIIYDMYTEKKADDVWRIGQSSVSKTRSKEWVAYPTQKPEELLRRILVATTDPGDRVFDGFSGSGTTAIVAQKMGRKWAVADENPVAFQTLKRRLYPLLSYQNHPQRHNKPKGGIAIEAAIQNGMEAWSLESERQNLREGSLEVSQQLDSTILQVEIESIDSTSFQNAVEQQETDWKRLIESVCVDVNYDGATFNPSVFSYPQGSDLADTAFKIPVAQAGSALAIRLIDVHGMELNWSGPSRVAKSKAAKGAMQARKTG